MLSPYEQEQIDRVAVSELVQRERVARDMLQWDKLAASYNDDSLIDVSWFRGTGAEFAAASEKMATRGLQSFHQMGPTAVTLQGNRALAQAGAAVHLIGEVDGVEVDVCSHVRGYFRAERKTTAWLLSGLRIVYIKDVMVPTDPTHPPKLDPAQLSQYRPSYRLISYMLALNGHTPRLDLPGTDRPETVAALLAAEEAWLKTGA